MDFWRGEAYQQFFDFLDRKGGFYYEVYRFLFLRGARTKRDVQRWGDAPVHSIAVSLFLRKEQTHFFSDIGYRHEPFEHCPADEDVWTRQRCSCDPRLSFGSCRAVRFHLIVTDTCNADTWPSSCLDKWRASGT